MASNKKLKNNHQKSILDYFKVTPLKNINENIIDGNKRNNDVLNAFNKRLKNESQEVIDLVDVEENEDRIKSNEGHIKSNEGHIKSNEDHIKSINGPPKKANDMNTTVIKDKKKEMNKEKGAKNNLFESKETVKNCMNVNDGCKEMDDYIEKFDELLDINNYLEVEFNVNDEDLVNYENKSFDEENVVKNDKKYESGSYVYQNFRLMIDRILNDEQYVHMFDDEDWTTIHSFTHLTGSFDINFYLFLYDNNFIFMSL